MRSARHQRRSGQPPTPMGRAAGAPCDCDRCSRLLRQPPPTPAAVTAYPRHLAARSQGGGRGRWPAEGEQEEVGGGSAAADARAAAASRALRQLRRCWTSWQASSLPSCASAACVVAAASLDEPAMARALRVLHRLSVIELPSVGTALSPVAMTRRMHRWRREWPHWRSRPRRTPTIPATA